ncbi:Thiol-disulfide isomerase or thioredoxin [Nocardioides terrae]|uniref:Thiol-disulfide isomerase or thioredoxin n=1 Tax=Nocardioides terrae TaxID=574651 RepID=A0A1I1GXJ0_9ACTN|nr:TlpA disulfide reductase family protein [Nocardioides terrae]SFC16569.1 Thiol-disulfide isomerase or thioredoxin [Nocardioides terrae]
MHRALLRAVVAVIALVLLAACDGTPKVSAPDESNVKLDTPAYRVVKQQAGIEDCPAAQTTDGGLPDVSLPCLGGGRRVDLSTLKGPLVLNFWYAACEPCRREMPALAAFYEKYGDRVPVLGVDSSDTMPGAALDLAKASGVTYPLVADVGQDLQGTDLTIRGYPTFYLLTADGDLKGPVAGGLGTVDQVVAMVEDQLGIQL